MKQKQKIAIALGYLLAMLMFFMGLSLGYIYATYQQEQVLFTQLAIRDYHLDKYMCVQDGRIMLPSNITSKMLYGDGSLK